MCPLIWHILEVKGRSSDFSSRSKSAPQCVSSREINSEHSMCDPVLTSENIALLTWLHRALTQKTPSFATKPTGPCDRKIEKRWPLVQGYSQLMHPSIAVANLYKIHDSAALTCPLLRHKLGAWPVMQKQVRFSRVVIHQFVVDSLSGCDGFSFRSWNFPLGEKRSNFAYLLF